MYLNMVMSVSMSTTEGIHGSQMTNPNDLEVP